jgi:hypothetical protein
VLLLLQPDLFVSSIDRFFFALLLRPILPQIGVPTVLAIDAHLLELSELVIFRGFASSLRTERSSGSNLGFSFMKK